METIRERWVEANEDWKHSFPYRMPVEESWSPVPDRGVHFAPNVEEEMAYGLTIISPWKDGGSVHVNFPEHLEYNEVGNGILRHHDKRINPWKDRCGWPFGELRNRESEAARRTRASVSVADGDRARFSLKILNGSDKTLNRVKPLLCFWYAGLAGFPGRLSDNFKYSYVVMDGKPVALTNIRTDNPRSHSQSSLCQRLYPARLRQIRTKSRGIDRTRSRPGIDRRDGAGRKAQGCHHTHSREKYPFEHGDPLCARRPILRSLGPGESAEAKGEILFTESQLNEAVDALRKEAAEAEAGKKSQLKAVRVQDR